MHEEAARRPHEREFGRTHETLCKSERAPGSRPNRSVKKGCEWDARDSFYRGETSLGDRFCVEKELDGFWVGQRGSDPVRKRGQEVQNSQ